MRHVSVWLAVVSLALLATGDTWGQPRGYVPGQYRPHTPVTPVVGGRYYSMPLFFFFIVLAGSAILGRRSGRENTWWLISQAIGGTIVELASRFATDGRAVTRAWRSAAPFSEATLGPDKVADKHQRTTRLLETLARRDMRFDPRYLRARIAARFLCEQQSWGNRGYGPVRFAPAFLKRHEKLLHAMRDHCLVNRIEDLGVSRLEFVHVCWPEESAPPEVTALITFEARIYFTSGHSDLLLEGSDDLLPYQAFWTFRRDKNNSWQLHAVDRGHKSKWLKIANRVVELRNSENGVILL